MPTRSRGTGTMTTTTITIAHDGSLEALLLVRSPLLQVTPLTKRAGVFCIIAIMLFAIALKRRQRRRYMVTIPQQNYKPAPGGQQYYFGNGAPPWGSAPPPQQPYGGNPYYAEGPAPPPYTGGKVCTSPIQTDLSLIRLPQPDDSLAGGNQYAPVRPHALIHIRPLIRNCSPLVLLLAKTVPLHILRYASRVLGMYPV